MAGVRRISAATSLHPASSTPPGRASHHEASTKVQAIHPSGLPLARRRPDGTSSRFGFPPSFAPRRPEPDDARRGGDRPTEHGPGTTLYDISRSSNRACSLITCDVVVATTRVRVSRALRSWARRRGRNDHVKRRAAIAAASTNSRTKEGPAVIPRAGGAAAAPKNTDYGPRAAARWPEPAVPSLVQV